MALTAGTRTTLNKLNLSTAKLKAGDELDKKTINPQAATADLAAAPTQADFNALLAKLRAAGVIASS